MRCDQWMGRNERAHKLIMGETATIRVKGVRIYPNGREVPFEYETQESDVVSRIVGKVRGAFNEVAGTLWEHTFPDGTVLTDFLQETIWSSGPCYYVALKDKNGIHIPESLWTEEELSHALWESRTLPG